jgi:hypothetical protein
MLKRKLYEKLKDTLGDYLFGFDEKKLDFGFFGGLIKLNDLILKPEKVN